MTLFLFSCEAPPPTKPKPNYLSLSYAFSKRVLEDENTNIADHNRLQNQISLYRKVYNDALALYKGKKFLDSVSKFEEAMNIYIEAETFYSYGKSLLSIGKFQEAIKAFEIAETLDYENKVNLYYNLACAYSLLNETESSIKYLRLSIEKGFNLFKILEVDSNLAFIRRNPRWKQILIHITSDKFLTKNPKEFLTNQTKKIKLKSSSKTYIYGNTSEDSDNIEMELFEGLAFYKEETIDKDGYFSLITMAGSYKIAKDILQIELKNGKRQTNHPSESEKQNIEESQIQPTSFELLYKENLNGFMKNDFVIYGDDEVYALNRRICAFVKEEESNCSECKKQYEQKGYFCAY